LGDIIVVSVQEAIPNAKVKKGEVTKAVIVRTTKEVGRADGSYIRFDSNSAVLVDNQRETGRHAYLRPGGARAARQAVHEDPVVGPRGSLSGDQEMRASIRKNDTVLVIAGRERGKTGKVLRILTKDGRALVERLNLVKRHSKGRGAGKAQESSRRKRRSICRT
jgi:hypothetical protein